MDPPPPASYYHNESSSAASSPRSSAAAGDQQHHLLPAKLRLMCSFGGHILPRPHDKSLCYVGGETRMVVLDRQSSLEELHHRLSHSLLNGRYFTIKYQLPSEDLDSLISISTDEDLENMIDEYDRFASSSSLLKPSSRLRLFLFPSRPETAASMGALLDDAKSETWFVDVLNGVAANLLPRGLSDSATINHTVLDQIDDNHHHGLAIQNSDSCADLESRQDHHHQININNDDKQVLLNPQNDNDVHQVVVALDNSQYSPPPVETNSSFGSSSSTPSMSNVPPIKVRIEDYQTIGLEDPQISNQVNMGYAPQAIPQSNLSKPVVSVGGENNRVFADDLGPSASDHGVLAPTGLRKPPLPLQPVQRKPLNIHNLPSPDSKHSCNFPSPDSVTSDSSTASAGSLSSKHATFQDPNNQQQTTNTREIKQLQVSANTIQEPALTCQFSVQPPPPDPSLMSLIPTHQTPQYIHQNNPSSTHYVQRTPIPMSSYYQPIYLTPQTQTDHHRPMYLLHPTIQSQTCYETPPSRPLTPPPNVLLPPSNNYGEATKIEATPNLYTVPSHQIQPQYISGISQIPVQGQSNSAVATNLNYGYEYSNLVQDQMYYAATAQIPPPSQYQTMTPAAAVMLSQASSAQINPSSENNVQS